MRVIALSLLCLLAGPALAQTDPALMGCVYPDDPQEQPVAQKIMALALPYLDNQFLYYRDDDGQPNGAYAVRRLLRIYFYDKDGHLMGTAIRRSQAQTSYFDPDGNYLGECVNHKLVPPDDQPIHFDPAQQ